MPHDATGFESHNHTTCVASALQFADEKCIKNGLKFTPVRRRTLEILLESHVALGAYEILDRLAAEGLGSKPPVVYRALQFLLDNGFAHRIEKLNAFVACCLTGASHTPAFLICRSCKTVSEANELGIELSRSAAATGFVIEQTVIEAEGLCPNCSEAA